MSGGEPLFQAEFCMELLEKLKQNNLNICMETCGFADKKILTDSAKYVDTYLFDYKETDPLKHKEFTGVSNEGILDNLRALDALGKQVILRCPVIPNYNDTDEHFQGIAKIAESLQSIIGIDIEPYHSFGESKYERLSKKYHVTTSVPDGNTVNAWISEIRKNTGIKVTKA